MAKHFFFEGLIQDGKSTLIRELIRDYLPQIGGFSCQRLLDDSLRTVGFRLAPASEAMILTKPYTPELTDVFLHFDGRKTEMKADVFTNTAIRYLKESRDKDLILLDEIGGIELMSTEFRRILYQTLAGDIPCIGVLKLEVSIRHMVDNRSINRDCIDYHLELRETLTHEFDAAIIRFERKNAEEAKKSVKPFLAPIFSSR